MSELLVEGDVIELDGSHTVYANVPTHFLYDNYVGCWDLGHGEMHLSRAPWLHGRYVVYKTVYSGGGTGHDDGYHVYCRRFIDERPAWEGVAERQVDFYQTGGFTAMIKEIEPVAKAEMTWRYPAEGGDNV